MKTLVVQLLAGQAAIDRMKKEVIDIVSTVSGFAHRCSGFGLKKVYADFKEGDCFWRISRNPAFDQSKSTLRIGLWISERLVYVHGDDSGLPRIEHVQQVHACLETFVQGMLKCYPEIQKLEGWQAIMKAGLA